MLDDRGLLGRLSLAHRGGTPLLPDPSRRALGFARSLLRMSGIGEKGREILAGVRAGFLSNLLRRALGDNLAALVAALRAEVD